MVSQDTTPTERERGYRASIESKIRVAATATRLRAVGVQAPWVVVIVAGAGVPLSQAVGGPGWVGPALGFVVVVAAGVERIFSRTTSAAAAHDELRRDLAREDRLYAAASGPYADREDSFDILTARCEETIDRHDRTMVAHGRSMTRESE